MGMFAQNCNTVWRPINSLEIHKWRDHIVLWDPNAILKYYVDETFNENQRVLVKSAMKHAVESWDGREAWNHHLPGMIEGDTQGEANFTVTRIPENGGLFASAFFPGYIFGNRLEITDFQLNAHWVAKLMTTLIHEIGHIYGLRHEFANTEGDNVPVGLRNDFSIMNYGETHLQKSDVTTLARIYSDTYARINGIRVAHFNPDGTAAEIRRNGNLTV